jgi:hypothetical protein
MWRRLDSADLKRAAKLADQSERGSRWFVCDEYEVRGDEIVAKHPFGSDKSRTWINHWRAYKPLEEEPDLFLRFARLPEESDLDTALKEVALEWSRKFGLLGGTSTATSGEPDRMKLSVFKAEAEVASMVRSYYETSLNRDENADEPVATPLDYRILRATDRPEEVFNTEKVLVAGVREAVMPRSRMYLFTTAFWVSQEVQKHCRPELVLTGPDHSKVKSVWRFDNLLGAMYLQMFWLMDSTGDLARCENCRRIMSLAKPHPDGRKRRRDKRFCSDSCRQTAHRRKKSGGETS